MKKHARRGGTFLPDGHANGQKSRSELVGSAEDHLAGVAAGLTGMDTNSSLGAGPLQRDAAHGCLRILLNLLLALRVTRVGCVDEAVLHHLLQLLVAVRLEDVLVTERPRPLEESVMEGLQFAGQGTRKPVQRDLVLLTAEAAGYHRDTLLEVLGANLN